MTVTIDIKPETQAGLLALAHAAGMSVEEYLLAMVEGTVVSRSPKTLRPDERAAAFEAWSAGHRFTPPLSDHAVSRQSMYEDRRL
ncbi:MAG TPA: hypothetical protein VG456_17515 [Candidatus Sulfopaludibacter sp.]|jgi:hypothetical protein|nr:hypothetical protein [Candidatus Sulfopaludibacter sp.]